METQSHLKRFVITESIIAMMERANPIGKQTNEKTLNRRNPRKENIGQDKAKLPITEK
jgi:hypothetical protein